MNIDWVARAWRESFPGRPYHARKNGIDQPLPAFCLKIPTGGGKTLLATRTIDLVNAHFLHRRRGLVLWIVPTTQIYNQTLRALKNRDHPYRQQLDLSSGQRTRVFEKTTAFSPRDVRENLCVLVLMLPSANRQTKDTLRMFRDSGGFDHFFPDDDDLTRHSALLATTPNLDTFEQTTGFWGRHVKSSLGNTLRLLRPLIILDEGHKAYSKNAKATLEGFNPCMIVELSATPAQGANVLVDIRGQELNAEEMIKLDLHIHNKASDDWRDTLLASVEHRDRLEAEARRHEEDTGVYIRPICVIQVERTGRQQRGAGFIHAEDVREYLMMHPGILPEHIAIKTSASDELKKVDDVGGLLARDCQIRFIITKQALQEGWDCPFAYVLTVLTNPTSRTGITQLVGRILRQPYATKTGVSWLDESYVFCFRRRGYSLLEDVRKGFGLEGLQGLEGKVINAEDRPPRPTEKLTARQRGRYARAARDLVLPAFMIRDEGEWRPVSYESDILSRVPWDEIDISPLADLALGMGADVDFEMRADLEGGERTAALETVAERGNEIEQATTAPNLYFAARHLLEVVPNPWRGYDFAKRAFEALLARHSAPHVSANYGFVLEALRRRLERERDRLSRKVFASLLDSEEMRFLVVTSDADFTRLPRETEAPKAKLANREDGSPYQRSLFDKITEDELNPLENKVATYLDQQARLFFWYRNRARKDYFVQGWKPRRIYADFIMTLKAEEPGIDDPFHEVFVLETKGIHLKGAEDTEYKRSVFDICSEQARKTKWAEFVPAMKGKVVRFEIVDEEEWKQRLNEMLFPG